LTREHERSSDQRDGIGARALYIERLYKDYRAAMMNGCSIVLIFQVYLTANYYEKYKSSKDQADKMKKEFFK
jgi:pyruvate/2-oxoacid:ferredoxin oxidoreductase beta subunit